MNAAPAEPAARFTEPETDRIADQFFRSGHAQCPDCRALMSIHYSPLNVTYRLRGRCDGCGRQFVRGGGQDPLLASFRPLNEGEKAAILTAASRGEVLICPVDGSRMNLPMPQRDETGRPHYYASCPRCRAVASTPLRG